MAEKLWWQKPLRVVQFNLQAKDAPLMDAEKIAADTAAMHANTLCINAGGIYAWYSSRVPFHHVNEFMQGRDIFAEVLEACHKRGIRVFGRFDFALAEDWIYLQKPWWFLRTPQGNPVTRGHMRPGLWRHLYETCPNGGFQNEDVGLPVLEEVLTRFDVDGLFWNGGYSRPCWCDVCREKYQNRYGKPLPETREAFEPDWLASCNTDSMEKYRKIHKRLRPDIPMTRYYFPFGLSIGGAALPADNIEERLLTGDMLCTEAQDILSNGRNALPEWHEPAVRMKMGRTVRNAPNPLGIIHTCPGMDWRHTGMPAAEYLYWTVQIPANGGQYWASVTGFPDTNTDKRILAAVSEINRMTKLIEEDMDGAREVAQVLLLCDRAGKSVQGWAEALLRRHILFDMLASYQVTPERLRDYAAVIVPSGYAYSDDGTFSEYVKAGGHLIVEGVRMEELRPVLGLLGVDGPIVSSEALTASYLRIEDAGNGLLDGMGEARLLPHRGTVGYCVPKAGASVLATLVPPFAPLDSVGAPPERASLPAPQTDIPLCIESAHGSGRVLFLSFEAGLLAAEYGMPDTITFLGNCAERISIRAKQIRLEAPEAVQLSMFKRNDRLLIHLVNGIGQRPLSECVPCGDLQLTVLTGGRKVHSVTSVIGNGCVTWSATDHHLRITLQRLAVWDMLRIKWEPEHA